MAEWEEEQISSTMQTKDRYSMWRDHGSEVKRLLNRISVRLRAASVNMLLRSGYHLSTGRPYRAGPEGGEVVPEGVLKLGF